MVIFICINKRLRAVFALLLAAGLICATVCVTVGYGRIERVFVPRFSAPEFSDREFYEDNIFYTSGYGIPNCTAYAWGRAYELLGEPPRLCTADAGKWFSFNKSAGYYRYGSKPKLGAIACFDNRYGGHVAVVESIEDGVITFSNSAYQGTPFYLSTAKVSDDNPGNPDWVFQGYIYLDDFSPGRTPEKQLTVSAPDGLNLREYAELSAEVLDVIPDNTVVTVSDTVAVGERIWGRTTYNGVTGYCAMEYMK